MSPSTYRILARHLQGINDQEYSLSLLPASLGWLSSDWGFEACRQSDEMITEPFGDWNLTVDWLVTQKHTQNTKEIHGEWLVGSKRSCQYSRLKTTFNVLLACCNEVSCVTFSATKGICDSRAKFQEPRALSGSQNLKMGSPKINWWKSSCSHIATYFPN